MTMKLNGDSVRTVRTASGAALTHRLAAFGAAVLAVSGWSAAPAFDGASGRGDSLGGVTVNTTENGLAPVVVTRPATLVTHTSAVLNARVTPDSAPAASWFEWGIGSTALQFNGVDDAVAFSTHFNTYPLSVTAWLKAASAGTSGGIVNKYVSASGNGWNLRLDGGRLYAWYFRDLTNYVWDTGRGLDGGMVDDGRWHHAAFTVGAAGGKLYVDGQLMSSMDWTGSPGPPTTDDALRLGVYDVDFFAGHLDEVTVWQAELSAEAIGQLMTAPPGPAHPQYASLLAYWPLDGDLVDARGLQAPGTPVHDPVWVPRLILDRTTPPRIAAGTNRVLNLDGVDDYVDVPDGAWFTGDFTVETWLYARRRDYYSRVIDFGNGPGADNVIVGLSQEFDGKPFLQIMADGQARVAAPYPVPTNQWVHLAATLQDNTGTVYVNGVPVAAGTLVRPDPLVIRTNNYVGRSLWGGDGYADALCDDLRVWNVARTPAQIRQFMSEPVDPADPQLLLNYRFDEASGATVLDSRSTAPQDGTLVNGAARLASVPVSAQLSNLVAGTVYYGRGASGSAQGVGVGLAEPFATLAPGSGTAVEFDGVSQCAAGVVPGLPVGDSPYTLEAWIKPDRMGDCGVVGWGNYGVSNEVNAVRLGAAGLRHYWWGNDLDAETAPLTGAWHHVAASFDGAVRSLHLDGVMVAFDQPAGHQVPSFTNFSIGKTYGDEYFDGLLDEVRIWNVGRTPEEISRDRNVRLTGLEPGLVACYRMDEGAGGVLLDATPNAHHALLLNEPQHVPSTAPIGRPHPVTLEAAFASHTRVVLHGRVRIGAHPNFFWFEWGTTPRYESATPKGFVMGGSADVHVSRDLPGLSPGVTYHYRLVASNSLGVAYGADARFMIWPVSNLDDAGPGSLRQAILDAASGATLVVTNHGTLTLTSGPLSIVNKTLALVGPGATNLAISGNLSSCVFHIGEADASISSLTIRDGQSAPGAPGTGGAGQSGGGIAIFAGALTLNDCVVTQNRTGNGGAGRTGGAGGAGGDGGGIYNNAWGMLTLNRCTISGNTCGNGGNGGTGATGSDGGVFYYGGRGGNGGMGGAGGHGGGVYSAGVLRVKDCTFDGNANGLGGNGGLGGRGGDGYGGGHGGTGGAGGIGGQGGGIYALGQATLQHCTLSGNHNGFGGSGGAGGYGGNGWAASDGSRGLPGVGGAGGSGGGLCNLGGASLAGCTLAMNTTGGGGAGYANGAVGRGGGIYNQGGSQAVDVVNTVAALNTRPGDIPDDVYNSFASRGHNLIGTSEGSVGFDSALGDLLDVGPQLGPLADNGGPTLTHALLPDSPAINTGDAKITAYLTTDQRGFARLVCDRVDIGAVEFEGCPRITATTLPPGTGGPHTATLQATVNPHWSAATAWFEWGRDTDYGSATLATNLPDLGSTLGMSYVLTGLSPGFTYHYRIVATNRTCRAEGTDQSFHWEFVVVTNLADSGPETLRQAVSDVAWGATLTLAATGTVSLTGGELVLDRNIVLEGPGATNLALSGNHTSRVLRVASPVQATISGLTIRDGQGTNGAGGGGMVLGPGFPGEPGGGVYNAGTLTLIQCAITGNASGKGGPGASFVYGFAGGDGGAGGGVYNTGVLTLDRCVVSGNSTGDGGDGGRGGEADGNGGAGGAGGAGGGICNAGTLTLATTTLSGNITGHGGQGGEGENLGGNGGAGGAGGGLHNTGDVVMRHATLAENSTGPGGSGGFGGSAFGLAGPHGAGGGLCHEGSQPSAQAANTIIARNWGSTEAPDASGTMLSLGHNLVRTNGTTGFGTLGDIVNVNPRLGPLADNGGPTWTHALLPGSPAINAGNPTDAPATDQRGLPRIVCGAMDIGAVEFQTISAPDAETLPAIVLGINSATLAAKVNPNGLDTTAWFEWGTTPNYGSLTPMTNLGRDTEDVDLNVDIGGLTPGATRHYRVVATNCAGPTHGLDMVFVTQVFNDAHAGLPGLWQSAAAWGDYDQDGAPDLLLTGTTNNGDLEAITRLYHNSQGSFAPVSPFSPEPPQVANGAVAWADYDRDGDPDFILTGHAGAGRVCRVYRNEDHGASFTDIHADLPGVDLSTVAWEDFDLDTYPDILIAGRSDPVSIAWLYRNETNGAFSRHIHATLPGVERGAVAWADYDQDRAPDILLTGYADEGRITRLYRNDTNSNAFVDIPTPLPGVEDSTVAWGDYNQDGYPDILLAGKADTGILTALYRNEHGAGFTEIAAGLPGVVYGSAAWGDYDRDGDLDILLAGTTDYSCTEIIARIYRNDGQDVFTDIHTGLTGVHSGAAAWADFDRDGDLDLMLTGNAGFGHYVALVYRNNLPPPAPPTIQRITLQPGAAILIQCTGAPGTPCTLQTSANLLDWNDHTSLVIGQNGAAQTQIGINPHTRAAFYRLQSP